MIQSLLKGTLLGAMVLVMLTYQPSVQAFGGPSSLFLDSNTEGASQQAQDIQEQFINALQELDQMDQVAVDIRWTDLDEDKPIGSLELLADHAQGHLQGQVVFNHSNYYPQETRFDFLSMGRHRLFYVKELDLLNSLAYFKQGFFNPALEDLLTPYLDSYTEYATENSDRINLINQPQAAYILRPAYDKLKQIAPEKLTYRDGHYYIKLERLDIPANFFAGTPHFSLDLGLEQVIQRPQQVLEGYQEWSNEIRPRLRIDEAAKDWLIKLRVSSDITKELQNPRDSIDLTPQYAQEMTLSSQGLTDKLTSVLIDFEPAEQVLSVTLEGIVENVELNFFTNETAQLSTRHVRLEYQLKPNHQPLLQWDQLPRMSENETDWLIDRLLNQTTEKTPSDLPDESE